MNEGCWSHLSIHPSIHSTTHPIIHPSFHASTQPSIQPPSYSLIHLPTYPLKYPSGCPSIYPSIHPSIHASIFPSAQPSTHPPTHLSTQISIILSICPSIHPFIYPPMYLFIPFQSFNDHLLRIYRKWHCSGKGGITPIQILALPFQSYSVCWMSSIGPPESLHRPVQMASGASLPLDFCVGSFHGKDEQEMRGREETKPGVFSSVRGPSAQAHGSYYVALATQPFPSLGCGTLPFR